MFNRGRVPRFARNIGSSLVFLALTAWLAACHHSGGGDPPSQPPQNPPPNTIGSGGGTATSSDSNASVTVPASALAQSTTITIAPATGTPAGNIGTAYDFGPNGTTFSQPVTIKIAYSAASLPAGVTEADLVLAKVVNGAWQVIPNSGVDGTTAGMVSGTTSSFSAYGVVPETPGNVAAVAADGQVTLTWDPVNLATSYNVYWRRTDGSADGKITPVASPFVHMGLANGKEYGYQVSAQKPIGEGGKSIPEVFATPMAAGVLPGQTQNVLGCAGNQQASIRWDPVSDATFYNVGRNDGSMFDGIATTTYVDDTAVNGATYEYTVTAVNAIGAGPASTPAVVAMTTLGPPTSFSAQASVGSVVLSWHAVPCADSYLIHWEGGGLNDDIAIPDPTTVEYTHTGLANGTTYTYTIMAVNGIGTGAASSPVNATPQAGAVPVQVSASGATCAVYSDGRVRCMGTFPGDGMVTDSITALEVAGGVTSASYVSAGNNHTCVVDAGTVKCWGANDGLQLGPNATGTELGPVLVPGISTASEVASGAGFTCAIVGGAVQCWGTSPAVGNVDLSTGAAPATPSPFPVDLPAAAVHISAGKLRALTCAVLVTSETWCWGNTFGEMDIDNSAIPSPCILNFCRPVLSRGLGPTTWAVVGRTHACYIPILSTLGAVCIGSVQGQLFLGLDPPVAFDVISAGEDFNCGISSGNAVCWGWNGNGQLGNGTMVLEPFTTAVNVIGVTNANSISAGLQHACAIDDNQVVCWGAVVGGIAPHAMAGF
jgi:hypothetical protein